MVRRLDQRFRSYFPSTQNMQDITSTYLNILNIMRISPFETCPALPLVCVLQARNRAPKIAYRWEAAGLPLQPIRASVAQASPFGRLWHVSSAGSLGPGVAPETQRLPTKLTNGIYSGDSLQNGSASEAQTSATQRGGSFDW